METPLPPLIDLAKREESGVARERSQAGQRTRHPAESLVCRLADRPDGDASRVSAEVVLGAVRPCAVKFSFHVRRDLPVGDLRQQYPQVEQFITGMLKDLDGFGTTFLNFMVAQSTVTVILLAFAGSVLAGNDHSRGGLIFYLSRRINVMHYAAGKLLAIGLIISLTTTLPALILFFEYGLLGDTGKYFW